MLFRLFKLNLINNGGCWEELSRDPIGLITIEPVIGTDLQESDVLCALCQYSYEDKQEGRTFALHTTNPEEVYAEDFFGLEEGQFGHGFWWTVGAFEWEKDGGKKPLYELRLFD